MWFSSVVPSKGAVLSIGATAGRRRKLPATVEREELQTRSIRPKPPVWRVAGTRHTLHGCCGAPPVRRPNRADLEPGGLTAANCEPADAGGSDVLFGFSCTLCHSGIVETPWGHSRSISKVTA
jgi:hypothetical protein